MHWASIVLTLLFVAAVECEEDWDYTFNGNDWPGVCRTGRKQSPIDINKKWTNNKRDPTPLRLINYNREVPVTVSVTDHYTIEVAPDPRVRIAIAGGGLRGTYVLQQMHFHWGSEHLINSQRYALEAHLVHFREIYGNRSEPAQNDPEGIAVLGTLFCLSRKNPELEKVIDGANGESVHLNFREFLPDNLDFFRYNGSLTTPPCSEAVVWTVFKNRSHASKQQIAKIRSAFPEEIHTTYRNVQPLNGREVEIWEFGKGYNKVDSLKSSSNLLVAAPLLAHNVHGIF